MDRTDRMFIVGLTVPIAAAAAVTVALRPASLWEWLAVVGTAVAAAVVVALVYARTARAARTTRTRAGKGSTARPRGNRSHI
ncbi:hypothetical protein [Streptomyces sp. FIT100]|uniref:hypothetical protein n=1 Tax=Streptomyces sp. FIT100 TaxID=2837956 RepID=UPI0021C77063|nr:hypothetical protein [Streptomyces sp. FIT100]UUN30089.1 hypothetical protein KK483_29795 [Streptomyces sp. FIT100]